MNGLGKKVVYQVYPKSFKDSNGDGIGDLQGVISKLDYLAELGVDLIWLNPFYPSPQKDNGYDVADYCAIDPMFGTMTDFEELVIEGKKRGIGLMLDMVFNHTSTEHEWFKKALAGEKKYQDYYFIQPPQKDGSLPTNWRSKFSRPAWEPFGQTGNYYLHLYDETQADLNWRNPEVREEMYQVVNFWLEKGVEGFRFDVINVIGKEEVLADTEAGDDGKFLYTDKPIVHEYLQEMNRATFGNYPEVVTVGEMSSTTIDNCLLYTQEQREELSMVFNFHHLKVDYAGESKWTLAQLDFQKLKGLLHEWGKAMSDGDGWNALFWNNHDQPRALSRFLDDTTYRTECAKLLAAVIHLNRGTPYIYQGEEIGMTNADYTKLEDFCDVETLNGYEELLEKQVSQEEAFKIIQVRSRDNSRTPMQWSDEVNGGFSNGQPWLSVNQNYPQINVVKERKEGSIFSFYQELIALRKSQPVISEGDYSTYLENDSQVYSYIRKHQGTELLVLANFFETPVSVPIPQEYIEGTVLIGNYSPRALSEQFVLQPYEVIAIVKK